MPDTITLLGSLARLDMQAVVGQPVWVRVHYAPDGKLLGGTEPPGTVLGEPGYAPTGYGSTRSLVTDEQGLFGGVLPWEAGGIYAVGVPGDVTRYLMMGTGAGEYPAGSTVNVRLLPGPDEVVTPSVTLDALVVGAVEDYLTAHPPTTAYELRGTGSPEGVVTAAVGTYYTDTAGTNGAWRWLKKTGTSNTGWSVANGNTGRRDVSSSLLTANGYTGGTLKLLRTSDTVHFSVVGIARASAGVGYKRIFDIPAGFRPAMANYFQGLGGNYGYSSGLEVNINSPSVNESFSIAWTTLDAWPSILPGTAA